MFKKIIFSALILGSASVCATELLPADIQKKPILPEILKIEHYTSSTSSFNRTGPTIQLAILLDTSSSMNGLINQARAQIWSIINDLSSANRDNKEITLQVGLFEYGKSSISKHEGYVQMLSPLTGDLDMLSEKLFSLNILGGDEYAGKVILESVNRMAWSENENDLKLIVIAGNESFRQGDIPVSFSLRKAAEKNIIVNTIFCGDYSDGISLGWKSGAMRGGGKYLNIEQNNDVSIEVTPYDERIITLGSELNDTYISYGSLGQIKKSRQVKQDENAKTISVASLVDRSVSKTSSAYVSESWDIVSAFESDKDKGVELALEQSKHFSGKSKVEIKKEIEVQVAKRSSIKSEIAELETKRTKFLSSQSKKNDGNDFGTVLINNIKDQAKEKGFVFN